VAPRQGDATVVTNSLHKINEKSSAQELSEVDVLAQLFESNPLTLQEKLVNPGLFMRRQELSYFIANYEVFKLVQNIKGSIFYFGVYHGAGFMTFANLSAALEPYNYPREIIGFDTFAGYPASSITKQDETPGKSFQTLTPNGYRSESFDFVNQMIALYDTNRPLSHLRKASLVKGDIMTTLPSYLATNQHSIASLIVLTINLYEPTKLALDLLWPLTSMGGVALIHTLNTDVYPGVTRAVFDALGTDITINSLPYAPNLAYIIKER
jgi:hypothetical protein